MHVQKGMLLETRQKKQKKEFGSNKKIMILFQK